MGDFELCAEPGSEQMAALASDTYGEIQHQVVVSSE